MTVEEIRDKYFEIHRTRSMSREILRAENVRLKNIVGSYARPLVSNDEKAFCDYIDIHVYKGNTTAERVAAKLGLDFNKTTLEEAIIKKCGSREAARQLILEMHKDTEGIINAKFEEHKDILSSLIKLK